jgi:hypothetical protein
MSNPKHLAKLDEGVKAWNRWRGEHPRIIPNLAGDKFTGAKLAHIDLRKANLERAYFPEADLSGANLAGADLHQVNFWRTKLAKAKLQNSDLSAAQLSGVNLRKADLSGAELSHAYCREADFSHANLTSAYLGGAIFFQASLRGANLAGANLGGAVLIDTDMRASNLEGCAVYGVSAWDVNLKGATQRNLIIYPPNQPAIEVDDLEIAQFVYLILKRQKIRQVIDTIKSKLVLILGRFTPERKAVLDALRQELRTCGLLPILFDFKGPASQTTMETISTLGHMARFVIADLTDAKSVLQELQSIVPNNPSVVIQPLLLATEPEPGMFDFFRRYPWVLKPVRYRNRKALIDGLRADVIAPAEAKVRALTARS